jgi:hypothetical protein
VLPLSYPIRGQRGHQCNRLSNSEPQPRLEIMPIYIKCSRPTLCVYQPIMLDIVGSEDTNVPWPRSLSSHQAMKTTDREMFTGMAHSAYEMTG